MSVAALAEPLIQPFQEDGAVVVRGLFSPDEIALVKEGIEANLAAPGPLSAVASTASDKGRFFEDFCNWQRLEPFQRFIESSGAGEMAGRLMQSDTARFYHDHLLIKEAGTQQPTPWHQDQPYYNIDGFQNCSLWIPVDPVPLASSLRFVAGSHRGPWLMPRSFMDNQSKWFPDGALEEIPDIEAHKDRYRILEWALEPGDAVIFHMLALHSSAGSATRRRVLSLRFTGDDVVHSPRPWKTSPEFPGLADRLPAGAPMEDGLFPVVWRR
jgi:ectoine hydroxylase-related dioxygenase (phytanoyl-CoA dioxygenase family)